MASLRKRGANWYVRYRDADGKQTEVKAGPDKGVARTIANELEAKVKKIRLGLLDPREAAYNDAERVHVATHVQDYVRNLEASGRVPAHVKDVRRRLEWFLDQTKVTRLSQIKPSVVTETLKTLRDAGKADRTVFTYCASVKAFTRWLKKDRRTDRDLLEDLDRPEVVTEAKRVALTPEQAARLISVTRSSKIRRGLHGEERAWLYLLAMISGLRRSELQSLTPESFALDADPPTVFVPGAFTKNGEDAIQPLPTGVIPDLRAWLSRKPSLTPVFPRNPNLAYVIRADLKAAGIPSDGFCFHSLRHTYISGVVESGASIKDAMTLARHAKPDLTFNTYSHARLENLGRVVNSLPELWAKPWASDRLCDFAHALPTSGVSAGLNGAQEIQGNPGPDESLKAPNVHGSEYARQDLNL
jgi:integrase